MSGALTVSSSGSGRNITLKDSDSSGTAATPWLQFKDSGNTDLGYVGLGSSSSHDILLYTNNGNPVIGGNSSSVAKFYKGGTYYNIFHDGYHPNADILTTARTINGVSFNGSANITVADSTKLPLAGGTVTGVTNFSHELRIDNGNGSTSHFNYSDNGSNYIRGTSIAIDCDATYSSGAGAITLNNSDIRSANANPAWTGNPGTVGKIQYHSNRWYFVGDSSANQNMITFRKDSTDVAFVRNNGEFDGEGLRINGTLVVNSSGAWVGSGIDADLLDGVQGSNYIRYDVNMTGALPLDDQKIAFGSGTSSGSTFAANHYSMGVDIADGGWSASNYSDLIIGYHTGIRIGAAYSGIRFYDNSPTTDTNNSGNGNGAEELLMTIGGGGSTTSGAHVTVHNNLSVGGTVDGRDVAADGSKLDGIAAGANNYSLPASPSVTNLNVADSIIHTGDTNTGINFNTDQITIAVGGSTELYVNTTGVRLGDSGNGYFQPVSGNYGSIQIDGGNHGGWEGYSIGGRSVFMHDNDATSGLYNDVNNEWFIRFVHNGSTFLYNNGSPTFQTTTSGAQVNGDLAVTGTVDGRDVATDGTKLDGIAAGATNYSLPASPSVSNLNVSDVIYHTGDNDTYIRFNTNEIRFRTGGIDSLIVNPSEITSQEPIAAPYFEATSDINLKTNIKRIVSPLEMLSNLNGYTFNWKKDGKASAGVMAQEVEKVLPSAVSENNDGDKRVNYNELIGVLVEAVKEQQIQIDALKNKLGE